MKSQYKADRARGQKKGPGFPGPRIAQQPPFIFSIALACIKIKRFVAGPLMPPRWPSAAPSKLRGRASNPHGPLERRLLYRLSYPAISTLYTGLGPKMFPELGTAFARERRASRSICEGGVMLWPVPNSGAEAAA